jgi:MFS transporter, DHA2 family, multidrug resistance protein
MSALSASQAEARASFHDWVAVVAGSLGALIAMLDISIVNTALPQIQGEIGVSGTEGTWISTGYLVAEVVMIPLTAWLSRLLGLRTLLLMCASLFTLFSMLCGFSHTLTMLIIARMGQGFFGGAMIPTAQTLIRVRLPLSQLPLGMTIFGFIALIGPLSGPVLGGWLTENFSWQWCFFINLPVAIALISLLLLGLPHQPTSPRELAQADWPGIAGLSIGLSALTVVLEEGQREQWFQSQMITLLAIVAAIGLTVVGITQYTSAHPILKLRLMKNVTFASVIYTVLLMGMVFYDIMYVLPQFLSIIAGYNAMQAGWILALSAIPGFMLMPVLPGWLRLGKTRWIVAVGLVAFVASCVVDLHLTAQSAGPDFVWSQLLRGAAQMLAFSPLNQASMASVAREDTADAAGIFSMSRNLGGSIGLALLGVFIDRRVEVHADRIRESVSANSQLLQDHLAAQASAFAQRSGDLVHGQQEALGQLALQIHQQALVMTYSDCFWVFGILLAVLLPVVFVMKLDVKPGARQPGGAAPGEALGHA